MTTQPPPAELPLAERLVRVNFTERRVRNAAGVPLVPPEYAADTGKRVALIDVRDEADLTIDDNPYLHRLLEEMRTRRSGDFMGDMEQMASHIRDRLASLANPTESQTVLESTGMYPDDRSDDDDPADHIDDEEPEEDGGP